MKNESRKLAINYEQPQMEVIVLQTEQCIAGSTQLDDMQEKEGFWELNY